MLMFDAPQSLEVEANFEPASTPTREPERDCNSVCPHCTYANWCDFDVGHTGQCHCSNGHYWGYG